MNFLVLRDALAHMIHEDPLGIQSPPLDNKNVVNHSALDLTNPIGNIECSWMDDYVRVYDPNRDLSFKVTYGDRTEAEVAAEVTKIMDYLVGKPDVNKSEGSFEDVMEDFEGINRP